MKRTIVALAAAGLTAAALSSPAQAHCSGCGVAAGVIGGLAAGAIIGSAIAAPPPPPVYVGPGAAYDYVPPAAYTPPPPGDPDSPDYVDGASCHMERQQVWDGYAYHLRRVQICE
jgi:hypothetical protein